MADRASAQPTDKGDETNIGEHLLGYRIRILPMTYKIGSGIRRTLALQGGGEGVYH